MKEILYPHTIWVLDDEGNEIQVIAYTSIKDEIGLETYEAILDWCYEHGYEFVAC